MGAGGPRRGADPDSPAMGEASVTVLLGRACAFSGETPVRVLCPFLNRALLFYSFVGFFMYSG